jgi:hypothetical protein
MMSYHLHKIIVLHPTVVLTSVPFADPHKGIVVPAGYPPDEAMMQVEEASRWHHPSSLNHLVLSAAE